MFKGQNVADKADLVHDNMARTITNTLQPEHANNIYFELQRLILRTPVVAWMVLYRVSLNIINDYICANIYKTIS